MVLNYPILTLENLFAPFGDKMTGRPGYDSRPERQNEYFVPGDGISREVIQADICRYLGNDALVRPGNHNVRLPIS